MQTKFVKTHGKYKLIRGSSTMPSKKKFAGTPKKQEGKKQKSLWNSKRGSIRSTTHIYRGKTSTGALNALLEHHAPHKY